MGVAALELGSRQKLEELQRNCQRSLQNLEGSDSRPLIAFEESVGEGLQERKENVSGNQRKDDPFYEVAMLKTQWKMENIPDKLVDLTKEICSQNDEGAAWFLLAAYGKM